MGRAALRRVFAIAVGLFAAGCDEDAFEIDWMPVADTAVIYSLARPQLERPSAFNLNERAPVRIE